MRKPTIVSMLLSTAILQAVSPAQALQVAAPNEAASAFSSAVSRFVAELDVETEAFSVRINRCQGKAGEFSAQSITSASAGVVWREPRMQAKLYPLFARIGRPATGGSPGIATLKMAASISRQLSPSPAIPIPSIPASMPVRPDTSWAILARPA